MNEHYCEREQEFAAALAGGGPGAEILNHARECAVCSEVLLVGGFLLEGAQLSSHEIENLPDATFSGGRRKRWRARRRSPGPRCRFAPSAWSLARPLFLRFCCWSFNRGGCGPG